MGREGSTPTSTTSQRKFKAHRALSGVGDVEFIAEIGEDAIGILPPIVQDGDEVYVDFSNFSGRFRVRGLPSRDASGHRRSPSSIIPDEVKKNKKKGPLLQREPSTTKPSPMTPEEVKREREPTIIETESNAGTAETTLSALEESPFRTDPQNNEMPLKASLVIDEEEDPELRKLRPEMPRELSSRNINLKFFSELHQICLSPSLAVTDLKTVLELSPDLVRLRDSHGRLPLHMLECNYELLSSQKGRNKAIQCALYLMELYPNSITTSDHNGRMPFTGLIVRWVEWTYLQEEIRMKKEPGSHSGGIINGIVVPFAAFTSSFERGTKITKDISSEFMSESVKRFPAAEITDEVEWAFQMLSVAMDHLGGKPFDAASNVRPRLSYSKQRSDRQALAENIAKIPYLLKTILLLESIITRKLILESTVIKRAILCHQMIGPWMTSMLRRGGSSSKAVVDCLVLISKISVDDYVGSFRTLLPVDEEQFQKAKLQVYTAIEELGEIIPSLVVLTDDEIQRAVTTPIIWRIMNRSLTRPFIVGLAVTDFGLHTTLMLAFRSEIIPVMSATGDSKIHMVKSTGVIFFVCVHFLLRRFFEAVAVSKISKSILKKYMLDAW